MSNDRDRKGKVRFPNISDERKREAKQEHAGPATPRSTKTKSGAKPAENVTMQAASDVIDAVPIHPLVLEDGVTHINIDAHARTELGRMLVHKHASKFEHPQFGRFRSVEGFWGFIRDGAKDDKWRYMSGMNARHETRRLGPRYINNFYQIIMEANFFKAEQNEPIKQLLLASTLPFDHYYIFRGKEVSPSDPGLPIRPQIAPWLTRGFEDIRKMLKEGRRPEKPDYSDVYNPSPEPGGSET